MPPPTGMYWATTTTGYLSAQATLYRTTDGGTAWAAWYHASKDISTVGGWGAGSVWIATGRSLLAIGGTGQVMRSVALPAAGSVEQLVVSSPTAAYLRMDGHIYGLDVATGSWHNASGALGSVNAMVWLSSSEGYAAVGPTVWRTSSGGQVWRLVFSAPVVGSGWASQLAANSMNSVWFLASGGVGGMSQVGFVLWHGTDEGTRWAAITDEAYWAPTGYPSVHPALSSTIMLQPGPMAAVGASTVYLAGWTASRSSRWVVLTNNSGTWRTCTIPITVATPQFFVQQARGSFVARTRLAFTGRQTGFLLGESARASGALLKTTDGGSEWTPVAFAAP